MSVSYKFSGHETFPCRYAWLPKGYSAIVNDPTTFSNIDNAMVSLGIGKNMVRALRFWIQAMGIAEPIDGGKEYSISEFGHSIFSDDGLDPFVEDIRTLWLIHWKLSTHKSDPLFAWDYLLNRWQHPEISHGLVLPFFQKEADRLGRSLSPVTLGQHFDVFLHTYVPTRSSKGNIQEDNLDSPLVELELIQQTGERRADETGKREMLYAFRREEKPEITPELFIYCIDDFWNNHRAQEKTLTFRDIAIAPGSPGQIFKLPELDIRQRLEFIENDSNGMFMYEESTSLQQLVRNESASQDFLGSIYDCEAIYA